MNGKVAAVLIVLILSTVVLTGWVIQGTQLAHQETTKQVEACVSAGGNYFSETGGGKCLFLVDKGIK